MGMALVLGVSAVRARRSSMIAGKTLIPFDLETKHMPSIHLRVLNSVAPAFVNKGTMLF